MEGKTRVNFHCHSLFSFDGEIPPEVLAEKLAGSHVQYAALTDHDCLDGIPRFRESLKKRGIGWFSGVELTCQYEGREIHLLGYGFDPDHSELQKVLLSVRKNRDLGVQSISSSLLNLGRPTGDQSTSESVVPIHSENRIDLDAAIALIHDAGGKAFLAHPIFYETNPEELDHFIGALKARGLDGIEAYYTPFTQDQQKLLAELAQKYQLVASAGTDLHKFNQEWGIDIPVQVWKEFRDSIIHTTGFMESTNAISLGSAHFINQNPSRTKTGFGTRNFVLRIFFPTLFAIALFIAAIWGMILPSLEKTLVERKREVIRELTNSAWSILASYKADEDSGRLTREQAQRMASERIETIRYGNEAKDYFWLQDFYPRIIMHPYRPDLNGQDVSNFVDPRGVRIFVEFADLVNRKKEGYIEYVWQWKDDPQRLEPKESYVKGFEPWGWIIGTGLYIDDVNREVARIEQSFVITSLVISGIVVVLLLFALQQSLRIEHERIEAENGLRESNHRYRSLVEATTEGTLLIVNGRCRYANPTLLKMVDYSLSQLEMLDPADLLPVDENRMIWKQIDEITINPVATEGLEGVLRKKDGSKLVCVLSVHPIHYEGSSGIIILAKDLVQTLSLATRVQSIDLNQTEQVEGVLHNLSAMMKRDLDRENVIEQLSTSMLFLQEPVGQLANNLLVVSMHTPIQKTAEWMTSRGVSAAIVETSEHIPLGMVTDHDLRQRVLAEGLNPLQPVFQVMTAPLVTISENAFIYEALMLMEEKGIQYLAVRDETGKIVNILRYKEMVQFHRYGSLVLANEISQSTSADQVIDTCQRSPSLVSALVKAGARPHQINRMISLTCDRAVEKLIQLAIEESGPAPVPFVFVAMGSHGRKELTLYSDQDNAIIYSDPLPGDNGQVSRYFLNLGERVVNWLDRAGYPLCKGNMMANNNEWCRPLTEWKEYFENWILKAEPQELLDFNIFFDIRAVFGNVDILQDLKQFVYSSVAGYPPFFIHFAKNAIQYSPPTHLFGRIYIGGGSMEREGQVNLKDALLPIVNFARVYSLRHQIQTSNTLDRIDELVEEGIITESSRDDISAAYHFLMKLRLDHHVEVLSQGKPMDNLIQLSRLSRNDALLLQQSFSTIAALQKKISYEFLGGT